MRVVTKKWKSWGSTRTKHSYSGGRLTDAQATKIDMQLGPTQATSEGEAQERVFIVSGLSVQEVRGA